jgi:hypothetical protein
VSEHHHAPRSCRLAVAAPRRRPYVRVAGALTLTALALLAPRALAGQEWRTVTSSRQVAGEREMRVDVEYGAGRLELGSASGATLYRSSLRYDAGVFTPRVSFAGDRLHIGMDNASVRGRNVQGGHLDLRLSRSVPLDLRLKFGAAEADLELGGLRIRKGQVFTGASTTRLSVSEPNRESCELFEFQVGAARFEAIGLGNLNAERIELHGGVGEVILDFSGAWPRDMDARVRMGLGALTIRLPRGVGVAVRRQGFLAPFDSQELIKRGDMYYSANWESARRKLTLDLEAAFGPTKVVWLDQP